MGRTVLLIFLSIYTVVVSSCEEFTPKKFEFFYYPARNVYYDVAHKIYLYSLNGGRTWDSARLALGEEPATLGSKVVIYSTAPDIWVKNPEHIQQYHAHTIDIAGIDTGLSGQETVAERKAKKIKNVTNTEPAAETEKKPGFFKRLFGKKK